MHVLVLNDGETYSDIKGCKIFWLLDSLTPDQIEEAIKNPESMSMKGYIELITEFK